MQPWRAESETGCCLVFKQFVARGPVARAHLGRRAVELLGGATTILSQSSWLVMGIMLECSTIRQVGFRSGSLASDTNPRACNLSLYLAISYQRLMCCAFHVACVVSAAVVPVCVRGLPLSPSRHQAALPSSLQARDEFSPWLQMRREHFRGSTPLRLSVVGSP